MAATGKARLTYINGRGLAEVIRLALGAAEIEVDLYNIGERKKHLLYKVLTIRINGILWDRH